jgi:transcriptional regulator with XRE-family HTH domain
MNKIKTERIRHGLTQGQLSNLTGIPARTIQNWENGVRKCPDYVEKMVLEKLDITFNQPDYKTIVEDVLGMLKHDVGVLDNADTITYVNNVIDDIEDMLK